MLPQLGGLKMHVPLTTKMLLRGHRLSCHKVHIDIDSNCMLPQLHGVKMHVPLSTKMLLRSHAFSC